jgi:hypothetical protein
MEPSGVEGTMWLRNVGGGAKGVNLDQITRDIEALTESYPFEIPSYFALILRCFSVLGAPHLQ